MIKHIKPVWLTIGTIILLLLLNTIIIITAITNNLNLLWMLPVSITLLIIASYTTLRKNHFLHKYLIDDLPRGISLTRTEWLSHSVYPNKIATADLRVRIGNDQCRQPYNASIFNIGFIENTNSKESGIPVINGVNSNYQKESIEEELEIFRLASGGSIWQIESAYLGCRTENGNFNSNAFKRIARRSEIKMIQLNVSSSIKPLPLVHSWGIVKPTGSKIENSIFNDSSFTTFRNAEGMVHFLNSLRDLSGGKPVGIRLCINNKKEFHQICYAICKTKIIPDFIVVDGCNESDVMGTLDQHFPIARPLYEALIFVSQTLQSYGLNKEIKLIASTEIISCFDILKIIALGADLICSQLPENNSEQFYGHSHKALSQYRTPYTYDFYHRIMEDTMQMMTVCGFKGINDITLSKFIRRLDVLPLNGFAGLNDQIIYPGFVKTIYSAKYNLTRAQKVKTKENIALQ